MKRVFALTALTVWAAAAAGITGTWKATSETEYGKMERTFVFKADGDRLTGETTSERFGKSAIEEGKIQGDSVSFSIRVRFQDNEMKVSYKGRVSGNQMKLTAETANGMRLEWSAQKVD